LALFHDSGLLLAVNGILLTAVSRPCYSLSFKSCMNIERYLIPYSLLNPMPRSHFCSAHWWMTPSCKIYVDFFIFIDFKLSVFYKDFCKYWINVLNGGLKRSRVNAKCCRLLLLCS